LPNAITDDIDALLGALARAYQVQGQTLEMTVLANSTASLEQTGYDNWNGGTYFYTLTKAKSKAKSKAKCLSH
jgi:hypothetical protein